jgi:hypothetical protein
MSVMTAPDVWADQDRALTVEDMENMPDDEFRHELDDGVRAVRDRLLLDSRLRDGRYEEVARVGGDEEFRAVRPFPVTVTPSALVRTGR